MGKLLHHPSLQRLLYQSEQRQQQYLVLEYIPGRVLRKLIREYPHFIMPEEKVVSLLLPICNALIYIHACGIIHRDVKPENILLGEDGKIILLDFGISLNKEKASNTKQRKLRLPFADVVGTPAYMPPERLQGEPGDERTDVYAIGVTLYEMLCGHTPFEDADGFTIINKQIAFDPPDILQLNPTVSSTLATVIMRAIRRNPNKRYGSMQHLFDDLNHLDKVTPEVYTPDRPLFGGRYRQVLQITLVILLIILGLVIFGVIAQLFSHVAG
jgi:serine/threonine-protein kinase